MDLLVVGAGEMGRWVADTVEADVAFTDLDRALAEDAACDRSARVVPTGTAETFDAVCLAVPMSAVPAAVDQYATSVREAVFDVSGAMAEPLRAIRAGCPTAQRASFHPLFAPPRVPGNVAAVIDAGGPVIDRVIADIEAGGNDVFETTAAEHDEAMETVQAGAHAAILAWRLAGTDVRDSFHTPISAALDDLADTVTEGSPAVYAEIQSTFDGAEDVADAAHRIAEADSETFEALYEEARGDRSGRERHE